MLRMSQPTVCFLSISGAVNVYRLEHICPWREITEAVVKIEILLLPVNAFTSDRTA